MAGKLVTGINLDIAGAIAEQFDTAKLTEMLESVVKLLEEKSMTHHVDLLSSLRSKRLDTSNVCRLDKDSMDPIVELALAQRDWFHEMKHVRDPSGPGRSFWILNEYAWHFETLLGFQLYNASQEGRASVVQRLLQQPRIDINEAMNGGATPLFVACQEGHELVVQLLLEQPGIDINQANNDGYTPLFIAHATGHEVVMQRLLEQPDIDINEADNDGHKPWFVACLNGHGLVVQRLFQQQIAMNQAMHDGGVPLYSQQLIQACNVLSNPDLDQIRRLIRNGADINAFNIGSWSPLLSACWNGHSTVVNILLQQAGIAMNQATNDGFTPLHIACQKGHELVVQRLLQEPGIAMNQATNDGHTPLYVACHKGHELVVQRLLQQPGIGMNQATNDGDTPLHIACQEGHELVVQQLLQQPGIAMNQAMSDGRTPLYVACHEGYELVVQRLLQQPGIGMNQARNDGCTLLQAIVRCLFRCS